MKKFTILILAGLLLPAFCFGAFTYSRTPSGYTISNPLNFNVSFDTKEELCEGIYPYENTTHWRIGVRDNSHNWFLSEIYLIENKNLVWNTQLPLGEYIRVSALCSDDGITFNYGHRFEDNNENPVFEMVEAEAPAGGIWTIPSDFLSTTTAYIGDTFSGIWTLIALVIGLPLSFWAIKKVIALVKVK